MKNFPFQFIPDRRTRSLLAFGSLLTRILPFPEKQKGNEGSLENSGFMRSTNFHPSSEVNNTAMLHTTFTHKSLLAVLVPALLTALSAGTLCAGQDLTATSSAPASFTLDVYALRGPSDTHATLYIGVYPINSQTAAPATLKEVLTRVTNTGGALESTHDYQSLPSPGGMASIDLGDVPLLDTISVQVLVQTNQTVGTQVLQGQTAVTQFALNSRQVVVSDFHGYGAQLNQNLYGQISDNTYTNTPPPDTVDVEAKVKDMDPGLCRLFLSSWAYPGGQNYNPTMIASFYQVVQLAQAAGAQVEINWVSITHPPNVTDQQEETYIDSDMQTFADTVNDLVKNHGITAIKYLAIQNEPSTVKWLNAEKPEFPLYKYAYQQLENDLDRYGIRGQFKYMGDGLVLNSVEKEWYDYMSTEMNDLLDGWSEHIYWDYFDPGKITSRLQGIVAMVQAEKDAGRPTKPIFVTEYGVRGVKTYNGVALKDPDPYKNGTLTATAAGDYINADGTLTPINETNVAAWEQAQMNLEAVNDGFAGLSKWDFYRAQYDFSYQDFSLIGYLSNPSEGQDQWPLRPAYYMEWLMAHTAGQHSQVLGQHGSADALLFTPFRGPSGDLTLFGLNSEYPATSAASISVGDLPANTTFNVLVWNSDGSGKVTSLGTVNSGPNGFVSFSAPVQGLTALTTEAVPSLP